MTDPKITTHLILRIIIYIFDFKLIDICRTYIVRTLNQNFICANESRLGTIGRTIFYRYKTPDRVVALYRAHYIIKESGYR